MRAPRNLIAACLCTGCHVVWKVAPALHELAGRRRRRWKPAKERCPLASLSTAFVLHQPGLLLACPLIATLHACVDSCLRATLS